MFRPKLSSRSIGLLLTAVAVAGTNAIAQTSRPASFTGRDLLKAYVASFRTTLVDAYDADGQHKPQWDEAAHAFLDRMAVRFAEANFTPQYWSGIHTDLGTMQTLAKACESVDDPIVSYCRAVVYKDAGQTEDYHALMAHAAPRVIAGHYPALRRYSAAAALVLLRPNDPKALKLRDDLLVSMVAEPTAEPFDRRFRMKLVVDGVWQPDNGGVFKVKGPEREAMLARFAADPHANPWLVGVLRGIHETAYAWEFRGNGWASSVTDAGWAGFRQHIALARKAFTAAYAAEPTYPEAPAGMITVCMAESGSVDDPRVWFDRAIAAQIDHMPAWQNYGEALRPRWGGTMEAMDALGQEAAATKRYDTVTPFFLLTALHMMSEENDEGNAVFRRPGVWHDIKAMYEGYLNPVAPGIQVDWCGSQRAGYAYRCGEYAEALRTLKALGDQVRPDALAQFGLSAADISEECAARTGPHADAIATAADAQTAGRFDTALAAYQSLLHDLPPNDPDRAFVVHQIAACEIPSNLADQKSTNVPFNQPSDLDAWRGDSAGCTVADGVLTFPKSAGNETLLLHRAVLPPEFRLSLEWSWSAPNADASPSFVVILRDLKSYGLLGQGNYPGEKFISIGTFASAHRFALVTKHAPDSPVNLTPVTWHTLQIDCDKNVVVVKQDGVVMIEPFASPWINYGCPQLGLRAHNPASGGTVKVRNLKVEPRP